MRAHQCKTRPIPGKTFTVIAMCRVFQINRRSYYGWLTRCAAREASQRSLRTRIQAIHAESGDAYGSRRIAAQLRAEGCSMNRKRVQRVMRELNIRGRQVRRKVVTTRSGRRGHGIPDLVDRQFHPERPDQLWVSDATCLPTREGSLFLAVILDACTRRVFGWRMSKVQDTSLMLGALEMAVRGRNPRGVILHSDQGCQYASKAYQSRCVEYGVRQSMGSAGDCYDNAMAESWFATLKREGLPIGCYLSSEETRLRVIDFIEGRYNTCRSHSALGYQSPRDYEEGLLRAT